jgi:Peptidase family M28
MKIFPRKGDWLRLLLRWAILLLVSILSLMFFTKMPGSSYSGPLQPLSAYEQEVSVNLKQQISMLAEKIGERNVWKQNNLKASAYYIKKAMTELGYEVNKQEYLVKDVPVENLEWELVGAHHPDEIILVGAHYDSVLGSTGANDNASGVAAVLEIARLLKTETSSRTVRFVTFVNEEPPFFQTDKMGSRVYASRSRQRGEKIVAMLSLETIGYYSNEKGSQKYPFPFRFLYPDTGNFIAFVGNVSSRSLVREAIKVFRSSTAFPSEGIAAPSWIMRTDWSDNWSFCKAGYPAIMITDTALFRYQYYHSQEDIPDKIDYERMARVVVGISRIIRELSTAK